MKVIYDATKYKQIKCVNCKSLLEYEDADLIWVKAEEHKSYILKDFAIIMCPVCGDRVIAEAGFLEYKHY